MAYQSPGGAFSNGLEGYLLGREVMDQKAQAAALDQQREQRLAEQAQQQLQIQQQELVMRRQEADSKINETERADTIKDVASMLPGDIPDADLVARTIKHHIPLKMNTPVAIQGPVQEGEQMPPDIPASYAGSPAQRVAQENRTQQENYIVGLTPNSPELKAARYSQNMGEAIPSKALETPDSTTQALIYINPRDQTAFQIIDGKHVAVTGPIPKDAHTVVIPEPASAGGNSAASEVHLDTIKGQALNVLDTKAKAIAAHIDGIAQLKTAIAANSSVADSLVADLVITSLISHTGPGVRVNQAMINRVVGGQSKWDLMAAELRQWSLDPSRATRVGPQFRKDLRALVAPIEAAAREQYTNLVDAEDKIVNSTTVKDVHTHRVNAVRDAIPPPDTTSATSTAPAETAAQRIERIRREMRGGK